MRIQVGDARLFFDVEGTKLVAEGPWMRERQTVVLIHPGPGFDHGLFKVQLGPWLSAGTQVVYLDLRGGGRSDRSTPEERRLERWADDVKELCDAIRIVRPASCSRRRSRGSSPSSRSQPTSGSAGRRPPPSPSASTTGWTSAGSPTSSASAFRCSRPMR